jgi:ABC-type lipoprotein release transport system permease subunit
MQIFYMSTILKIAWRNLWRNWRRTIITIASIFFAVLLSSYMTSMQEGNYVRMVDLVVKFYTGYLQVFNNEYAKNKSINYSFDYSDSLIQQLIKYPEVKQVFPRLESFSLVSSESLTKGAMVFGIDPEKEDEWTKLSSKIRQGTYLNEGDKGAIIGEGLSKYLKLGINDTLIIIGQGYHGVSAAGKFPVRGIIRHVSPDLDKIIVYLDINTCQDFFSASGKCTSLIVNISDPKKMGQLLNKLKKEIREPLRVTSWKEIMPEIAQRYESDHAGGIILKIVLYLVLGFGILAVIMMMISERKIEMGVMVSIGMQKTKLARVLLAETFFIGLLGIATGLIVSIPLVFFQASHPIELYGKTARMMKDFGVEPFMYFSTSMKVFTDQVITVFILTMMVAIYPVITALSFNVIKSLRK